MNKKNKKEKVPKKLHERRLLPHAPDPEKIRDNRERRGESRYAFELGKYTNEYFDFGVRYEADFPVEIINHKKKNIICVAQDISSTGMLIKVNAKDYERIRHNLEITLCFEVPEGSIKEEYQRKIRIKASVKRCFTKDDNEQFIYVALQFEKNLNVHLRKSKWISDISISSILLGLITLLIILLRVDSFIYFRNRQFLYAYSIFTAAYLISRYIFAIFYKNVPINPEYTPGVSIIIPCFNEEKYIHKTIISCLDQNYPLDKIEVIVVDDFSTDNSVQSIKKIYDHLVANLDGYDIESRLKYVFLKKNKGKRGALAEGLKVSTHEFVTFVDSDSFLEPLAIRFLVQPFVDPRVGAVTGRTDVSNAWTNWITKMQGVRYYIAFRILKAAESVFDAVTCLSGPIACYRKDLLEKYVDDWLNQKFFGVQATFGDDRSMTNFILKHNRTVYQDAALCKTVVPSKMKSFLKQQMRWKRSWLRESIRAGGFMWRKEPFQAISFYAGFIVPFLAPLVVIYNLIYIPFTRNLFPIVFLSGILLMSLLMSVVYMMIKKSRIWIYGLVFCLFYECVLLWQMPIAILTFWKKTWGTRDTKEDVEAKMKRRNIVKKIFNNEAQ